MFLFLRSAVSWTTASFFYWFFAKSIRMFIHRSCIQLASLLLCHYMQCSSNYLKQRHHCPSFLLISKAANRLPHSTCIHFSLWSLRYTLYISLIYTIQFIWHHLYGMWIQFSLHEKIICSYHTRLMEKMAS